MKSDRIRSTFLDFFEQRGHLLVPEGSLIPDDDSLLFASAGMVPLKPYFTGDKQPPQPRLMSAQRCVRTVDIENIGHTTRHATSFEMLGNFAFGDYFKLESMVWALELLTEGYGIDRDRLWVTVFETDDETEQLWLRLGLPAERIQRLGIKDNYWSLGVPGPAGPNSEIFYDRGERYGVGGGPAVNSERFLEIWNLVFMQPGNNIDTGMGLDRMALLLQGVDNVHEIDLVSPLLAKVRELTGRDDHPVSHRIITDHLRASELIIGQGVRPANTGRGYVLRRLLRRSIYHLRLLGVTEPVLGQLTGDSVIEREERAFERTLRTGSRLLQSSLSKGPLDAKTVFTLHDTHGFPVDLTEEIAAEQGVRVDRAGFDLLMEEHRRRSRGEVG